MKEYIIPTLSILLSTFIFTDSAFNYTPISGYIQNLAPFWAFILMIISLVLCVILGFVWFNKDDINRDDIDKKPPSKLLNKTYRKISLSFTTSWFFICALGGLYFTATVLLIYFISSLILWVLLMDLKDIFYEDPNQEIS